MILPPLVFPARYTKAATRCCFFLPFSSPRAWTRILDLRMLGRVFYHFATDAGRVTFLLEVCIYSSRKWVYEKQSRGLYCKTLQIRNLQKMDGFLSKLVSFLQTVTFTGLDKHISRGVRYPRGDNLKVVWAELSTLG